MTNDESLSATVARLDERTFNLGQSVAKIEKGMGEQSAQLGLLVADLNNRAGAEKQTGRLGRWVLGIAAVGGPLGAVWAYFWGHK